MEVVRISEGPLREVPLYTYYKDGCLYQKKCTMHSLVPQMFEQD